MNNGNEIAGYMVFYLERSTNENGIFGDGSLNEIKITPKTKIIPKHLKDKFLEHFGSDKLLSISGSDIENFLEKNK